MPVEYPATTSSADEGWDVNALEEQRWEANEAYGKDPFPQLIYTTMIRAIVIKDNVLL